jgi:hypothetical protein
MEPIMTKLLALFAALALSIPISAAFSDSGLAGTKKCCTNCNGSSCNTCNTPLTNQHGQLYCPALEYKATCDANNVCTKGGWSKKKPGLTAG